MILNPNSVQIDDPLNNHNNVSKSSFKFYLIKVKLLDFKYVYRKPLSTPTRTSSWVASAIATHMSPSLPLQPHPLSNSTGSTMPIPTTAVSVWQLSPLHMNRAKRDSATTFSHASFTPSGSWRTLLGQQTLTLWLTSLTYTTRVTHIERERRFLRLKTKFKR